MGLQSDVQSGLQKGVHTAVYKMVYKALYKLVSAVVYCMTCNNNRLVYNLVHKMVEQHGRAAGECTIAMHRHTMTTHPARAAELMCSSFHALVHAWRVSMRYCTIQHTNADNLDCGIHGCAIAQCHRFRRMILMPHLYFCNGEATGR